jgi:hypothetical protein
MGGIPAGNGLAVSGVASPVWAAPDHGGGAPTWLAWRDGCAGWGTLMGSLHPGQGTVFPNAFSVTFKALVQWGQVIWKDIG